MAPADDGGPRLPLLATEAPEEPPPNPLAGGIKPHAGGSPRVTHENIRKTSAQTPGLGFPATPGMTPITSPELRRRSFTSTSESQYKKLWLQVALSCMIMFTEGFYATQIFPYVSFMTEELRNSKAQLGVFTGLFYTSQSAGMLVSASMWARASNKYGRRRCLLAGLSLACVTSFILAISEDYWFAAAIRLLSGLLNNNLSIVRTALREAYMREKKEDTAAFSMLSVAFGASCVAGPSMGGILYGMIPDGTLGVARSWTAPMLLTTTLYLTSFLLSIQLLPETADLKRLNSLQASAKIAESKGSNQNALLQQRNFKLLLLMAGGHSYIFTGWELVYPLIAREDTEHGGEHWNTKQIGFTFLVGSIGLMLWSLAVYPKLAKAMDLPKLWVMLWVLPIAVMPLFARAVPLAMDRGLDPQGKTTLLLNYGTQLCISICIGCQFISVQLLVNQYVAGLKEGASLLAMANGYLVSTQALVRAMSPLTTGGLFNFGTTAMESGSEFFSQAVAFDHLSLVAFFTCVVSAVVYSASAS